MSGPTYTLERDLQPIMEGKIALPNAKPVEGDVGAHILHYRSMYCGTALLVDGQKQWSARFFLDCGQGGQLEGSGVVAWSKWDSASRGSRAFGMKFAICEHEKKAGPGANPSRGWHPGRCTKCGLDMTVDSGD